MKPTIVGSDTFDLVKELLNLACSGLDLAEANEDSELLRVRFAQGIYRARKAMGSDDPRDGLEEYLDENGEDAYDVTEDDGEKF